MLTTESIVKPQLVQLVSEMVDKWKAPSVHIAGVKWDIMLNIDYFDESTGPNKRQSGQYQLMSSDGDMVLVYVSADEHMRLVCPVTGNWLSEPTKLNLSPVDAD